MTRSVALLIASLLAPAIAHAHPAIDRGVSLYEEADFDGALEALSDAERSGELTRSELLRLLATRALVHFALGQSEPLQQDLTMLASIEPDYDLGARAPPAVQEHLARIRERIDEPLALRLSLDALPGGARLVARVVGDRVGAVRNLRVVARVEGGRWQEGEGGAVVLPGGPGTTIEAWARAVGPGGAVLARAGDEDAPRFFTQPAPTPEGGAAAGFWDGSGPWIATAIGVVAVAAAVIVVLLVTGGADQDTILLGPTVDRGR